MIKNEEEDSKSLSEYNNFGNLEKKTKQYIDDLKELPRKYSLFFKMPGRIAKIIKDNISSSSYSLSSKLRLEVIGSDHINSYPPPDKEFDFESGLEPIYVMGHRDEWSEGSVYLKSVKHGYIGPYFSTRLTEKFKFEIRAFCGLGLAQRVFDLGRVYNAESSESKVYSYLLSSGSWERAYRRKISSEASEKLRELSISRLLDNDISGKKAKRFVLDSLSEISKAFQEGDKFEAIRKSGQWLFDSHCGSNELLHFVQATVALEILLGDKARSDLVGLSELLRNRCAYLIGKDREQRDKILEDFGDIYDVRSKIVHRGKKKLTKQERKKLYRLRWMCFRVIQEELELLDSN